VSLKLELFQKTGSFKPRGAFNELMALEPEAARRGVVGVSGGNFAQGLAFAGQILGIDTQIIMPEGTPEHYIQATLGYGATIEFALSVAEAFRMAEAHGAEGRTVCHPFDDRNMMAGNGTLGLELTEDAPDVTDVFVSIGGGGLMTGVATAVRATAPEARIWGVETEGSDAMAQALTAGGIVEIAPASIAKTLAAPWVSRDTLAAAETLLEDVIVVPDVEAYRSIGMLMERVKVLAEPAASCTLAAASRTRDRLGEHVVLILCGGNVSLSDLIAWNLRFGEGS
jgi:threonine dehydratase